MLGPRFVFTPLAFLLVAICGCDVKRTPATSSLGKKPNVLVTETQQPIVDEDYQFRIDSPGRTWKIMGEAEFSSFLPDACAGAASSSGTYGAIIAEPLSGASLEGYTNLIRDSLPTMLVDCEMSEPSSITYQGYPASQFTTTGSVNGANIFYLHTILLRGDFAMQLISWSMKGQSPEMRQFLDMVTLTEGEMQIRAIDTHVADFDGPGQQIRDGNFISPVYGIVFPSQPEWKTLVGNSLQAMTEDAIVGFESAQGLGYGAVIAETMYVDDLETLSEELRTELAYSLGAELSEDAPRSITAFGREIPVYQLVTQGQPQYTFFFGVTEIDRSSGPPLLLQIQLWSALEPDKAFEMLKAPAESMSLLSETETSKLREQSYALPDMQNVVGPEFSLRRGIFRDFNNGVRWRKPGRGTWKISVGDEAAAQSAALYVEEIETGMQGMLIVEPAEQTQLEDFHNQVLAAYELEQTPAITRVKINGVDCLSSEFEIDYGDASPWSYRIATAIQAGRAMQLLAFGQSENVQASNQDSFINGFEFPGADMRKISQSGNIYRDERLGIELTAPDQRWKFREITQPQIRPMGGIYNLTLGKSKAITVAAIYQPSENVDLEDSFVAQMMASSLQATLGDSFELGAPSVERLQISGVPVEVKSWDTGKETVCTMIGQRDSTTFFALAIAKGRDNLLTKQVKEGLKLFD